MQTPEGVTPTTTLPLPRDTQGNPDCGAVTGARGNGDTQMDE